MRVRCNNPNDENYKYYGGRGVKVCERWDSFANFLSDMGARPEGTTIDRVDPNGDYTPENCRWSTVAEQNRNKRTVRKFVVDGKEYLMKDIAAMIGRDRSGIGKLIRKGVPMSYFIERLNQR